MKFVLKRSPRATRIAETMSIETLLRQVMAPHFEERHEGQPFGSMFFHSCEREEAKRRIQALTDSCEIPPLVMSDLEAGAGRMVKGATRFPSMLACSQANDPALAYEMGKIAALEAGALGYNVTLAPVADLLLNPDSPVVSLRSAGDNPDHTIPILSAYIDGLQAHGMAATIKHFPGDGTGTYDQHLTTPANMLDLGTWRTTQGRVFRALIDEGVHFVMPGHISFPAFDEADPYTGFHPPATLSRRLLQNMLRDELGFAGLIVSDAMNMGGVAGFRNYFDACADFLTCGGDILLFVPEEDFFFEEMCRRIESGRLSLDVLRDRAERVLSYKLQIGLLDDAPTPFFPYPAEKAARVAREVVDNSVTLVRDRAGIIPTRIERATRVLHLVIVNDYAATSSATDDLLRAIQAHSDHVTQWVDPGPNALFQHLYKNACDLVICSAGSTTAYGLNVARLHGPVARNMMQGWMRLGVPVIFVVHQHPFFHKEYEMAADTVINTYGDAPGTAARVMAGITGNRPLTDTLYVHS
jgi:beta-N-acetylhexosaminidase